MLSNRLHQTVTYDDYFTINSPDVNITIYCLHSNHKPVTVNVATFYRYLSMGKSIHGDIQNILNNYKFIFVLFFLNFVLQYIKANAASIFHTRNSVESLYFNTVAGNLLNPSVAESPWKFRCFLG